MRKIFEGGTVVTAEGSFRADVAVEDETIAAVGVDLPRDGAEIIDVSGAKLMPGFIDGHTHMDMPFGGTVTADNWDTGTAAALAGGTTMLVDFSLQDPNGTLGEAVETWQGKAETARIDYGLHVAITNLTEDVKRELPSLPDLGVATVKIFMAYKGTPLYTPDEDLFEAMQIARNCGLLVLVHAENGDVIVKLQAQALARGDTEPRWHGPREVGVGECEVLAAGLAVDRLSARVRLLDRLQRAGAGDVHDEQRAAGELGQPDRPVGRLGLDRFGPRQSVPARLGVAARQRLRLQLDDHVAVLGVHKHEEAAVPRDLHRLEQILVGGVERRALVRHEDLHRRDAEVAQ